MIGSWRCGHDNDSGDDGDVSECSDNNGDEGAVVRDDEGCIECFYKWTADVKANAFEKPACVKRPWEGALYKWLTKSASDAMHMALYKLSTSTF